MQLAQSLLFPGTGNYSGIVEGQLTAGKDGGGFTQEAAKLLLQALGCHIILAKDHHGAVALPVQTGHHVAAVDLADAGHGSGLILSDRLRQCGVLRYAVQ